MAKRWRARVSVSLATVYNTLHQFTNAGLLREIVVEFGQSNFDTNIDDHHHFYHEESNRLEDVSSDLVDIPTLPAPPHGTEVNRVDVIIRVRENN